MKNLVDSMRLLVKRKDSRSVIIVSSLVFFFLLLVVQNGEAAWSIFELSKLPLLKKLSLFIIFLFDVTSTFTVGSLILAILGSLLGAINLSLAYTYMKIRGEMIIKSGLYSGLGLVVAFFGIGCAACGTALLSVLLGFFGFSTMLNVLPYNGQEIGYIGLLILCVAMYSLSKRIMSPNVC